MTLTFNDETGKLQGMPFYVIDYAKRRCTFIDYMDEKGKARQRRKMVDPMLVFKSKMLTFAAELENDVWSLRMTVEDARLTLAAAYPETNRHVGPRSANELIMSFPDSLHNEIDMNRMLLNDVIRQQQYYEREYGEKPSQMFLDMLALHGRSYDEQL